MEVWLRPNVRILYAGCTAGGVIAVAGIGILGAGAWMLTGGAGVLAIALIVAGAVLILAGALLAGACALHARKARMACDGEHLMLNLGASQPFVIPLDIVEVFFLGQGKSGVPGGSETTTVVVRLAERAEDWKKRDVSPRIARWCDGYITLLGAWTEPVDAGVVTELNHKLLACHRALKAKAEPIA